MKEEIICGDEQLRHCKELPKLKDLYFSMSPEQQKQVDRLEACCEEQEGDPDAPGPDEESMPLGPDES